MGFAHIVSLPPPTASVRSDVIDLQGFGINVAYAINEARKGKLTVTLQIALATSDTTTIIEDSRIGPWTYMDLAPLSAAAAAKLPGIWYEMHQGTATIHHAATGAGDDLQYILLMIG